MKKSRLNAPRVNNPLIDKALFDIYNELNRLIDKTSLSFGADAPIGSIRAVYDEANKVAKIEGKTSKGWISSPAQFNVRNREYKNAPKIDTEGSLLISNTKITSNRYLTTGPLTLDVSGDIELNADGGEVKIYDGTTLGFTFDVSDNELSVHDSANPDNKCAITVSANGASIINTRDVGGSGGHLTLNPDGHIKFLTADGEVDSVEYLVGTSKYAAFSAEDGNHSTFKMYENGGASTDDYFELKVEEHGATTIKTMDATTSQASLTVDAKGPIHLDAGNKQLYIDFNGTSYVHFNQNTHSLKMMHSLNTNDYFDITVGAEGATTISTVDADTAVGHLTLDPDGKLILTPSEDLEINGDLGNTVKSTLPIKIKEIPAAYTDSSTYGQIWVKNSSPNELYFTTGDGDDIQLTSGTSTAGGGGGDYYIHNSARCRTQYNNWYYGANTAYGFNYYYWVSTTSSTSIPSAYVDSLVPGYIVPKNGTVKAYTIIGNITTTDTWEWILMKGAQPTYGSAGNYTLSQVGSTQSAGGTANILYKWEETGLSVAVNAGDMVIPYFRRTTDNDASYSYAEISMVITLG